MTEQAGAVGKTAMQIPLLAIVKAAAGIEPAQVMLEPGYQGYHLHASC